MKYSSNKPAGVMSLCEEYRRVLEEFQSAIRKKGAAVEEGILTLETVNKNNIRIVIRIPVTARVRPSEQDVALKKNKETSESRMKAQAPLNKGICALVFGSQLVSSSYV